MKPSSELASFVDGHLSRGSALDPVIGAVVIGLAEISNAFTRAQSKTGDWKRILASLGTGTEQVRIGIDRLRAQPGFEGLVEFAERQRAFALAMIEEVARLQVDEPTRLQRFAAGDVFIDYGYENAKFRYEKHTGKVYRRFYGQAEVEIRASSDLYNQAILGGREITRDEYYAD